MEKILTKDEEIALIAGRIMDEFRKHPDLEWHLIAAKKIYSQWNEYYNETNKWIRVEDDLPKNQTPHVLVKQKGLNHPTRGYFTNNEWIVFYHGGAEQCDEGYEVTHWQPLPNSPK